jgi:eukaryotic-like serine/threonine-protein kinase
MGGVTEVADLLGVSRQRLSRLRERPDFPDPIGELAVGPIWDLDAVKEWNGSGSRQSSAGRPSASAAARTLGSRFVLEEKIGFGGFADVFRAADRKQAGRLVAVKVLQDVAALNQEAVRRFRRELRLLEGLSHPNVIRVLGHGETVEEGLWYAMPLAQGSLADSREEITGNTAVILGVMRQVCAGLAHIHEQKIFHRDLKPGNVLRTGEGSWAIADLGLAVEVERQTTALTSTLRGGLGSVWYTAPEQWKSAGAADARSDIYSVGKVLQELVTGEPPVNTDMPAGPLRPVVERATENRPEDRYQTVAMFLSAVEAALGGPGDWESPEEAAKRLLQRVRLPKPPVEDLDELLTWALALDENDWEDMSALSRVLPWISRWSVQQLWSRNRDAFRRVFRRYSAHVASSTGFDFGYCDVLADFARHAVEKTGDMAVLRATVSSLAPLGYHHNRWHVRDVLTGILQSVRDSEAAMAAVEGMRDAGRTAVAWSVNDFSVRSLHPLLRAEIENFLNTSQAS